MAGLNGAHIVGLATVVAGLNKAIAQIQGRTSRGLLRACIEIKRETESASPLTPVDTGNMRASFFIAMGGLLGGLKDGQSPMFSDVGADGTVHAGAAEVAAQKHQEVTAAALSEAMNVHYPFAIVGYSAYYAAYVHENMEASHWSRPGSGPKWLEQAMMRAQPNLIKIIQKEARIT